MSNPSHPREDDGALQIDKSYLASFGGMVHNAGFRPEDSTGDNVATFFGTITPNKIMSVAPVTFSEGRVTPMVVVSEIQLSKKAFVGTALLRRQHFWPLLALLPMFGSLILISWWVSKRLQGLTDGMNTVAQGRYDLRLPESGPPEIEAIHTSFNRMAKSLQAAQRRQPGVDQKLQVAQKQAEVAGKPSLTFWPTSVTRSEPR